VRQVQFNAWHYAETDLWASLVAELFAQLAAPPKEDRGAEHRRQSRLAAELIAQRDLRERLQAARARHHDLQQALHKAKRDENGSWQALTDEQKQQLTGGRAEKLYREVVGTLASVRETGRGSWRILRRLRLHFFVLIGLIIAVIAIAWGIPSNFPLGDGALPPDVGHGVMRRV
jgi:predicted phage-related endonuclease